MKTLADIRVTITETTPGRYAATVSHDGGKALYQGAISAPFGGDLEDILRAVSSAMDSALGLHNAG